MGTTLDSFWEMRLKDVQGRLEANNFEVYMAQNREQACKTVLETILPSTGAASVSFGGSATLLATGIYETFKKRTDLTVLDTFDKKVSPEEKVERRRQALLVDLFLTGTNALTEDGRLVNLDMYGNRVGAIAFGPKNVVVLVGRNKLVHDLDEAMCRVKDLAAPANALRLNMKTPCVKTSFCQDCASPERICNVWTITEKSFPKGRIKVVLINEDLGL